RLCSILHRVFHPSSHSYSTENSEEPNSMTQPINVIQVIDSHTGGEPTRVVTSGGPDLGSGGVANRLKVFREKHDSFRSAVVTEPRGSDVIVGALLIAPSDLSCVVG